jgi:drug/metabolite transporter (DMT)-like permease
VGIGGSGIFRAANRTRKPLLTMTHPSPAKTTQPLVPIHQQGGWLVALGAALWGTETYWRVRLNSQFPSDVLVFYEHIICLLVTLPVLWLFRQELRGAPKQAWAFLVGSAVLGSALGAYWFTLGLRDVNASLANVLLQIQPLFSAVYARWLLKEQFGQGFFAWGGLAMAAGVLLSVPSLSAWGGPWGVQLQAPEKMWEGLTPGLLAILGTSLCWSFATVAGRGVNRAMSYRVASPLRFLFGLGAMAVLVGVNGHWQPEHLQVQAFASLPVVWDLLLLSIFAGVIPLFIYFKGLSTTPASVASFWEMFQIVAALLVTWGLMNEVLQPHQVLATLVLMGAVCKINHIQLQANPQ